MQYRKYQKIQFWIQLYIDIWKISLYLQTNPYRLKTGIFIALLVPLLNN